MEQVTDPVINLLQREYLFQGLTGEQLAELAKRFQPITLPRNTVIYSQGQQLAHDQEQGLDFFYFIEEGRVRMTRRDRAGEEHLISVLGPGDFFGEEELLNNQPRSTTVTTTVRTRLLRLSHNEFLQLLQEYPDIEVNLNITAESRALTRRQGFSWLGADEAVYFVTRKHEFFLYKSLILPILLFVGSIPILALAVPQIKTPFFFDVMVLLGLMMFFFSILWGVWNWLDWGNDFYVLTNQRVVRIEKVIALYESRREAPLDTVLAVNVFSSFFGRIINYGDVTVKTYTGSIKMLHAKNPTMFSLFIEGYRQRYLAWARVEDIRETEMAFQQTLKRRILENQEVRTGGLPYSSFPMFPFRKRPVPQATAVPQIQSVTPRKRSWQERFRIRDEQEGYIQYRKHPIILLRQAWLPLFGFVLLFGAALFLVYLNIEQEVPAKGLLPWILLWLVCFTVNFGIFAYDFFNWTNDIYQVTPDQLIDIEKKPLGEEAKKTANLDTILSIEHERANIIGILFNFGDVIVNVGETKFIFYGVPNPDQVQQDVADYREALNRRKKQKEIEGDRNRVVDWLASYHHVAEDLNGEKNNEG